MARHTSILEEKKGKMPIIPIPSLKFLHAYIYFPNPAALIPPACLLFLFLFSAGQNMYQSPCTFLLGQ